MPQTSAILRAQARSGCGGRASVAARRQLAYAVSTPSERDEPLHFGTHFSWACNRHPGATDQDIASPAKLVSVIAALTSMSSLEASSLKATIIAVAEGMSGQAEVGPGTCQRVSLTVKLRAPSSSRFARAQ